MRIGMIPDTTSEYREVFNEEFANELLYTNVTDLDRNKPSDFDILTVGDSFSQQKNHGYQNLLAKYHSIEVLHYNKSGNVFQNVNSIFENDFLDFLNTDVDYILVQSVERLIVQRILDFDKNRRISAAKQFEELKQHKQKKKQKSDLFFTEKTIKFIPYSILYAFDDNAFFSQVYSVNLKNQMFSVDSNKLLFFYEDLKKIDFNNNKEYIMGLNYLLNELSHKADKRDIQLIFMPSPDKFDFYYDSIIDKDKYEKPLFFNLFKSLSKDYIYINTKEILKKLDTKDIYFYDDTHWSPIACKAIVQEIASRIK